MRTRASVPRTCGRPTSRQPPEGEQPTGTHMWTLAARYDAARAAICPLESGVSTDEAGQRRKLTGSPR